MRCVLSSLVLFALLGCSSGDTIGSPATPSPIDAGGSGGASNQPATPEAAPPVTHEASADVAIDAARDVAVSMPEASTPDAMPPTVDAAADHRDAAPITPPSDAPVTIPGLVAQYDFEDPTNLGREDVARADSVEFYNAAQTAGHIGQGVAFSGGYLMLPALPKFQLAAGGDFSIEVWLRTDQRFANNLTNLHFLTCATSTTHAWGLAQLAPDNAPQLMVNGLESALGTTDVYDGKWHHVVGTRAGQTLRVYVDGQLEGTTVAAAPIADSGCAIALGRDGACCQNFSGAFDRVRLWQKRLTDAEVASLAGE